MSEYTGSFPEETLSFGAFELYRGPRVLVSGGQRIRLGGRALDILIALVERAGEVVTKKELMAVAWPFTFVDESNLRVHIAALRKLLSHGLAGDRSIVNIAGRGYLFSTPVVRLEVASEPPPERAVSVSLPEGFNALVGREAIVAEIVLQVPRHRLLTIAGPAGVGKSAVALAVSEAIANSSRRLCFVDLSAMIVTDLLPATLAAALDVSVMTHDPMANLIAFLADQDILVILDNCEHVIDAVTTLAETLMRQTADVRILVTSREPLLASAESVFRLQPLEFPPGNLLLTAKEALQYSAVRLFVDRATNGSDSFEFGDAEAAAVAEICQRLDGMPLAIELIAARVDLFGIGALATNLGERLMLGTRGSRTAKPRQQSIRGALDWSHDLLSDSEKLVFRRFSVFRGLFSLESAVEIIADKHLPIDEVLDAIALLTAKSLVSSDTSGTRVLYRLLHITRAYAGEKLAASDEGELMERLHATHFRNLLATAEALWETMTRSQWTEIYGYTIDDVRAALDWAFSPAGDLQVAATLIAASLPFGFGLSLIDEFKTRAERALVIFNASQSPVAELRLVTALTQFALNASIDAVTLPALFERIDILSPQISAAKYKIEPLLARVVFSIEQGDYAGAAKEVTGLSELARQGEDPLAMLATDRIAAQAHHFIGNYTMARALAERVIRHPAKVIPIIYSQSTIDRQVTMRIVIARSLWIEGRVDQAIGLMTETMDMAYKDGPLPITFALATGGCLIAFWSGNLGAARQYADELVTYSRRYTLDRWGRLGEGYVAALDRLQARPKRSYALIDVPEPVSAMHRMMLATVDPLMVDPALTVQADAGLCGWCNPEILRISGEQMLQRGGVNAPANAERYFLAAIANAEQQGALSWELRATTSLAALWHRQDRSAPAHDLLGSNLGRFSEGAGTADHQSASSLLTTLAQVM